MEEDKNIKKSIKRINKFRRTPEAKNPRALSEEGRYMLKDVSQDINPEILQLLEGKEKQEAVSILQKELTDAIDAALQTGASNLPMDVENKIKKLLIRESIITGKEDTADRLDKIKNLFKSPDKISHFNSISDSLISRKLLDTLDDNTEYYASLLSNSQNKEVLSRVNTIINDIYQYIGNLNSSTYPNELKTALDSLHKKRNILKQSLSNPTADEIEQNANSIIDTQRKIAASQQPEDKELLEQQLKDLKSAQQVLKQDLQKQYTKVKTNIFI